MNASICTDGFTPLDHLLIQPTKKPVTLPKEVIKEKVGNVTYHIFNSYLFGTAIRLALTVSAVWIAAATVLPVGVAVGLGLTALAIDTLRSDKRLLKGIVFEISLLKTIQGDHNWWEEITPSIVLGAIPLENHISRLRTEVNSVLTMLEPFEVEAGLVRAAITSDWEQEGISHKHIHAEDFKGVPVDQIKDGVEFLRAQIEEGKKVYVHCKAGRGRSATIVVCYLLKYGIKDSNIALNSFKDVFDFVKSKRSRINLNTRQRRAIAAYCQDQQIELGSIVV